MSIIHTVRYIAFIAVVISFAICSWQVREHALHNSHPQSRRLVIRILWMVPVYAIESFIGLLWPDSYIYCDVVRDFYEALVIYSFFQLLANCLLNGERNAIEVLSECERTRHLFPFCCLDEWKRGEEFYIMTKIGILQYVPVKLMTPVIAYMWWRFNFYHEGTFSWRDGYIYIFLVTNISQVWALYCLVLFYLSCKSQLEAYNPIPKFLCIKLVVFATWWQAIILDLLIKLEFIKSEGVWSSEHVASQLQDFIICLEMVVASACHSFAFPVKDFTNIGSYPAPLSGSIRNNITTTFWTTAEAADFSDVISDVHSELLVNIAIKKPMNYISRIKKKICDSGRHHHELVERDELSGLILDE